MVLEGGLSGAGREGTASDEVLDELVVLRERGRHVERDGVLCDESNVGGFNVGQGHWSVERMVNLRCPRVLLSSSNGRLWWYLVISSGAKI